MSSLRRWGAVALGVWVTLNAAVAQRTDDDDVVAAADRWLHAFAAKAIQLADGKRVPADGFRRIPARLATGAPLTELGALELLATALAAADTRPAAERLLRLAALGNVPGTDSYEHALARGTAEAALEASSSMSLRAVLLDSAQGDSTAPIEVALRTAALRALGHAGDQVFWPVLARGLADADPRARGAAALSLADLGNVRALRPLVVALATEGHPVAIPVLTTALADLLDTAQRLGELDPLTLQDAVAAAAAALGRGDARVDLDLVRFLDQHRARAAVPALIAGLERIARQPAGQEDRVSLALRTEIHRVLRSMTGAVISATEPERWRAMWDSERDKLVIHAQARGENVPGATVAGGFFGIPVLGRRVVFVLDTSGSMQAPAPQPGETYASDARVPRRLDVATRECWMAVKDLPADTFFNVVTFATQVRTWKADLVPATSTNKNALKHYLARLIPDGSTNLWGGLTTAVQLRTAQSASRYREPVDEVFLLSDGYPSSGDITDGGTIIARVNEMNRHLRIRINTVFIGSVESSMDRMVPAGNGGALMEALADGNNGKFVLK